ncbi:MAG: hypothetical protein ACRDJF_07130 [Actinomycetota bacterium]
MTLRITGDEMVSDICAQTARRMSAGRWAVAEFQAWRKKAARCR